MKNILLSGPPGIGKTTIIRKIIKDLKGLKCAGFYTSEIRKGKARVGFNIMTLDGQEGVLAHIDIKSKVKVGKYKVDAEVLEDIGADSLIRGKLNADILVIDEIGKMELTSELMQAAIFEALNSDKKVLGTILEANHYFTEDILSREDTLIIKVNVHNRETLVYDIANLLLNDKIQKPNIK